MTPAELKDLAARAVVLVGWDNLRTPPGYALARCQGLAEYRDGEPDAYPLAVYVPASGRPVLEDADAHRRWAALVWPRIEEAFRQYAAGAVAELDGWTGDGPGEGVDR